MARTRKYREHGVGLKNFGKQICPVWEREMRGKTRTVALAECVSERRLFAAVFAGNNGMK